MSLFLIWILGFENSASVFLHGILKLQDIKNISVVGLALSFTITVIAEASLLLFFIYEKLKIFHTAEILKSSYKILISGIVMIVAILLVRDGLVKYNIINMQTFLGIFLQLILASGLGIVCYIIVSFMLKSEELKKIKSLFFKT